MCLHHIVAQGVSGAHSFHPHAIHDVICLSVRCWSSFCLPSLLLFLFHCLPVLCSAHQLQCRHRRGLKTIALTHNEEYCTVAKNNPLTDSGALTHMRSKKKKSSDELETLRSSRKPTVVLTANGEVHRNEEAQVFVHTSAEESGPQDCRFSSTEPCHYVPATTSEDEEDTDRRTLKCCGSNKSTITSRRTLGSPLVCVKKSFCRSEFTGLTATRMTRGDELTRHLSSESEWPRFVQATVAGWMAILDTSAVTIISLAAAKDIRKHLYYRIVLSRHFYREKPGEGVGAA